MLQIKQLWYKGFAESTWTMMWITELVMNLSNVSHSLMFGVTGSYICRAIHLIDKRP